MCKKLLELALVGSAMFGQLPPTAALIGDTVSVQFGALQIDSGKLPGVKKAAFGFIHDATKNRQYPIKLAVEALSINELGIKLLCPDGTTSVDPLAGSACIDLDALPTGKPIRMVVIYLESLAFKQGERPLTQFLSVPVENPVPTIGKPDAEIAENRTLPVSLFGISRGNFIKVIKPQLSKVKIHIEFGNLDFLPALDLTPIDLRPSPRGETLVQVILPTPLPKRPEAYTVKLTVPASLFPQGDGVSNDLTATYSFDKTTFPAVDEDARKKSSFFVDATFRSFVDPTVNKGDRRNSGLLAFAWRPTVAARSYHAGRTVASIRPLISASVSTDPLRELVKSGAPTQLQSGADFEIIRNHFQSASLVPFFAQSIFAPGIRHESDRDLKFQTLFARFAYTPIFHHFTESREYRAAVSPAGKSPLLSAWSILPTFSYDRGAVVRDRLQRLIPYPLITDTLSRANFELAGEVEFARAIRLTVKDTYSYLWYLPRRPNRNFFSGTIEINSGYLFNTSPLAGIQNALIIKFERGEQTPTYKPVNSFSVGFKVYK